MHTNDAIIAQTPMERTAWQTTAKALGGVEAFPAETDMVFRKHDSILNFL
ncbi:MAG: hypothetical protein HQM13_17845 [SAR324 cluster bacterium]|nr:hypothetical protein [SAR324 cluster bacterium]